MCYIRETITVYIRTFLHFATVSYDAVIREELTSANSKIFESSSRLTKIDLDGMTLNQQTINQKYPCTLRLTGNASQFPLTLC